MWVGAVSAHPQYNQPMRWWVLGLVAACGCDQVFGLTRPDAAPITGLVAWYPMDEVVAGALADMENHHDATCFTPTCAHSTPGVIGNSIVFDGTQAFTVSAPELSTPAGFTVTMWFAIDAMSLDFVECPANKRLGPTDADSWQACLVQDIGQIPTFYSGPAGLGDTLSDRNDEVDLGTWHHLAIRWDGFVKTIVLDGVLRASAPSQIGFDGGALLIGADIDNGAITGGMIGRLDELRIYDHPLDYAQIATLAMP